MEKKNSKCPSFRITGYNIGATKEPCEPNHSFLTGGKSVWWSWTAPTNASVTIPVSGDFSDFMLLAAYLNRRPVVPDQLVQSRGDLPERAMLHGFDEFGKHIAAALDHFA